MLSPHPLRAAAATDPEARRAALHEAVAAHTGVLADAQDYDWIEPARGQVRRHGVHARLHLADIDEQPAVETVALARTLTGENPRRSETIRTSGASRWSHRASAQRPARPDSARR